MKRLTQDKFIFKCKEKHGDKYDYSLVEYINISKKIQIICKKHGVFSQISKNHKDDINFINRKDQYTLSTPWYFPTIGITIYPNLKCK